MPPTKSYRNYYVSVFCLRRKRDHERKCSPPDRVGVVNLCSPPLLCVWQSLHIRQIFKLHQKFNERRYKKEFSSSATTFFRLLFAQWRSVEAENGNKLCATFLLPCSNSPCTSYLSYLLNRFISKECNKNKISRLRSLSNCLIILPRTRHQINRIIIFE